MGEGNSQVIHVALLDEGTEVWRPVEAVALGNNVYRIISENANPDDEQWEFITGDKVRCEKRILSGNFGRREMVLVAVEKV